MRARALTHAHTHTGASVYGHDVSHTARVVIGVALGMLFVRCTKSIVESYEDLKLGGISGVEAGKILLIVSVMTLHSFAEGLGIGVSFCGKGGAHLGAFISASLAVCVSLSACLSLWVGARACICLSGRIDQSICESTWYTRRHTHTHTHTRTRTNTHTHILQVHNVPEGLAVALVLVPRGVPKFQTFAMAILSSLPQPIIAVWCLPHPVCHRPVCACACVFPSKRL